MFKGGLGPVANVCRGGQNYSYATARRIKREGVTFFGNASVTHDVGLVGDEDDRKIGG